MSFMAGLRRAAEEAKPLYGECGGYMVLGEYLIDAEGCGHAMAGLLPLETSFAARRLHLGYREASLLAETPLGRSDAVFRGHEFHYATVVREGPAASLWSAADACGADLGRAGLRQGSAFGSFIHLIDRRDPTIKYGDLAGLFLADDLSLPEDIVRDFEDRG
jgi:cobyrinic acid a,c-diamide synthase